MLLQKAENLAERFFEAALSCRWATDAELRKGLRLTPAEVLAARGLARRAKR